MQSEPAARNITGIPGQLQRKQSANKTDACAQTTAATVATTLCKSRALRWSMHGNLDVILLLVVAGGLGQQTLLQHFEKTGQRIG